MLLQELYNNQHSLSDVPLGIRIGYILPAFIMLVVSDSNLFNLLTTVIFLAITFFICSLTSVQLLRLYKIPLIFILLGCLTISLSISQESSLMPNGSFIHILEALNINLAAKIFLRSTAMLSIVYFGLLTHSISEISHVMRSVKIPALFIDLFILTYKFVINLSVAVKSMRTAQILRQAYIRRGTRVASFTMLSLAIFRKAVHQSSQLNVAIESRLGSDSIEFLNREYTFNRKQLAGPVLLTLALMFLLVILIKYA